MNDNLQTFRRLLPFLPAKARAFLWVYVVFSSALAGLDVAALMLLAVSLTGMVNNQPISLPVVGTIEPSGFAWVLLVVCGIIIVKAIIAIILQWVATRRFASYELEIGDRLFAAYIKAPWTERLRRNTSQLIRLADVGIASVVGGFMLPVLSLPAMFTTFVAVVAVLVIAQPLTAAITLGYLGLIACILYFIVARKSIEAGRVNRTYSFKVARLMTDMVNALKEITLRNSAPTVARAVHDNRIHTTRARSNLSFLGQLPKFVFDAALVGGFLLVGGASYLGSGGNLAAAFSSVALFGVAGYRLVPSLTGFQSVMTQTHANVPIVNDVIRDIEKSADYIEYADTVGRRPITGEPRELQLKGVRFTYPHREEPALHDVDLVLPMGATLGIAGSSGAGKTTLVDLILGLLVPSEGSIRLDGVELEDVLMDWRSRVGYVPQDVSLFDGTVAQNVALTWGDDIDRDKVREALERAQLLDTISQRPGGIDSRIGDRGMALSGGQRQRLGIARALYGDPLVLVMDEATSALDTKTESDVAFAIRNLRGQVTIVSVAHRLSTIRDSDQVVFMRDGTILANGTFDEVVAAVPDFATQAALAGLVK
ncbi:ABC transporter ATP-binding protein [Agromyces sp. H3Y2-19a]|uniref:ABC transporter ATP-binding protein n=1 Tax=Agromyces chromiiresistens TaxID=3030835 RepID=UPI0023BA1DCF|nr:ABC transporter ATP-binding protein [Agromyces chromiiresistens]MDF0514636.1 ABC transporter ATP-binding protein [Agromyces chromiiresistens]